MDLNLEDLRVRGYMWGKQHQRYRRDLISQQERSDGVHGTSPVNPLAQTVRPNGHAK